MSTAPRAELVAVLRRRCALLPEADRARYLAELPRWTWALDQASLTELMRAVQIVRWELESGT